MSEYVLMQLRIPASLAEKLRVKTARLKVLHDQEVDAVYDGLQAAEGKASEKLQIKYANLHERGRKITTHNVARVAISIGLIDMTDTQDALDQISDDGIPLGRPRRAVNE